MNWFDAYCPTCGLSRSRWAGCIDPFHDVAGRDITTARIGNSDAVTAFSGTPVRIRMGAVNERASRELAGWPLPEALEKEGEFPLMADECTTPCTRSAVL